MQRRRFVFTLCMEIRRQRATRVMRFEIMRIVTISYSTYEMLFECLMKVLALQYCIRMSLYIDCGNLEADLFKIFIILPYLLLTFLKKCLRYF